MSYSQLILSDRPAGYWEYPQIGDLNLLTENQYSLETSTSGWSAVDSNTSISRTLSDSYIGDYSLSAVANSTNPIEIRISSGSRIEISPGVRYTMVARIKRVSGSRNASIRVEYFTTQNGSTLSESVRQGREFELSSTEWTTVYHTDIVGTPNTNDYFMSWGVITDSGSSSDEILVDGIQFYEGTSYQLLDRVSTNNANIIESSHQESKPIIFGTGGAMKLSEESFAAISNDYRVFISGSESKPATLEFWFTIEQPPSYRHTLVKIGNFLTCYIERDRIYIESNQKSASIQVADWDMQHYVAITYVNKKIDLHLDNRDPVSILLDESFSFSDISILSIPPTIIFGSPSAPRNLIQNPSFEQGDLFWSEKDNSTIQSISSDSFSGDSCVEVTKSSDNNSGLIYSNRITVKPYKKYYASAYVKIPSGAESASIRLACDEYEEYSGGTAIATHSESISVADSDGWTRVSLSFTPGIYTNTVELYIDQPTAGTSGEIFLVDAVLLEKSESLKDWDEKSDSSDPLFISSIAVYPYQINALQISKRMNYAMNDSMDALAIRNSADRIETQYSSVYATKEIDVTDLANKNEITLSNFIPSSNGLYMDKIDPVYVESGPSGGSYEISRYGVKLIDDSYIQIINASKYINTSSCTIRMQIDLDDTSGDGNILTISPIIGYYSFIVTKESNTIAGYILSDYDDASPTQLFASSTLTSGEYDIALNIGDLTLSALVGSEEFNDIDMPNIGIPPQIYLGSTPGLSNAVEDYIRNFCIDTYTEFSDIDWYDPGLYMLRFNGSFSVTQKATFEYVTTSLSSSNNSVITFNNASQPSLIVNNEYVYDPTYIPSISYSDPDVNSITAVLITENALIDSPKLNNLYLSSYDSDFIASSLSNYSLVPNVNGSSQLINEPYIIKTRENNVLAHDSNIGIMFVRGQSTGCRVIKNSVDYECLEFIFKINKTPNAGETYNIFDLAGATIGLSYDDSGLTKYGTYDIYIDGQLTTNPSALNIYVGEIYHVFIDFGAQIDNDIHLGTDKNQSNCVNGSIGKITVYENAPNSLSTYVSDKYDDLLGRITHQISGGDIEMFDTSEDSPTYYRDDNNEYYEMLSLPAVKFVLSSWEEIDLDN